MIREPKEQTFTKVDQANMFVRSALSVFRKKFREDLRESVEEKFHDEHPLWSDEISSGEYMGYDWHQYDDPNWDIINESRERYKSKWIRQEIDNMMGFNYVESMQMFIESEELKNRISKMAKGDKGMQMLLLRNFKSIYDGDVEWLSENS